MRLAEVEVSLNGQQYTRHRANFTYYDLPAVDDVRPLSRGDIEKEIAAGRIARTTDMEMLD